MTLRREELRRFQEGHAVLLHRLPGGTELIPDELFGYVDMGLNILTGSILLHDGIDTDVQLRIFRQLPGLVVITVNVRERNDLAAFQDQQPVIDGGFAACGKPQVLRHQPGADDGCLL